MTWSKSCQASLKTGYLSHVTGWEWPWSLTAHKEVAIIAFPLEYGLALTNRISQK